jgi:hypothetical protein
MLLGLSWLRCLFDFRTETRSDVNPVTDPPPRISENMRATLHKETPARNTTLTCTLKLVVGLGVGVEPPAL